MPSSESDSDEDCYGNVARKLQCLKNNYRAVKSIAPVAPIAPIAPLEKSNSVDRWSPIEVQPVDLQTENSSNNDSILNLLEEVPSVPDLPPIMLPNAASLSPNKRVRRRSTRLSKVQKDSVAAPSRCRKNRKRAPGVASPLPTEVAPTEPQAAAAAAPEPSQPAVAPAVLQAAVAPVPLQAAVAPVPLQAAVAPVPSQAAVAPSPSQAAAVTAPPARGRGGRRARGSQRGRGRGRPRRSDIDHLMAMMNSVVYSVGNTHEYPDKTEDVPIFSQSANKNDNAEVVVVDEPGLNSSFTLDENEELSVKVYWQQTEYVKFNIRRFQKLAQIFEFFGKRESVERDKVLFTLRGRILRPDDTPDSIQYNVGLFIDGGIVHSSIANLAAGSSNKENNTSSTGIMLKFQCQNVKRPFETNIEPHQKLCIAMMKCAEHFELPYAKLRFTLDGETLNPAATASEQDLDHGDCIDVKMVS